MGTNETNENVTNAAMNAADETVANAPAPKKNHGGAWKAVLAVVLTAGVVGSTTLSAFNLAGAGSELGNNGGLLQDCGAV